MVVIVVVGMPGSGKDLFVRMARKNGYAQVRMGDVVRDFAKEEGLDSNDVAIGGFANDQRKLHGDDVWALRTLDKLPRGNSVIDGSRSMTEIDCFRNAIGNGLVVMAIKAPEDQRFHRLRLRAREDDPLTVEDFARRDEREISWGILKAIAGADLRLTNDAGLDEFRGKCLDALENITSSVRKNF